MTDAHQRAMQWRRTVQWTVLLLTLWLGASFGAVMFARELGFKLFAAPFGVWMAGQGALVVFLGIVWINFWIGAWIERGDEPTSERVS